MGTRTALLRKPRGAVRRGVRRKFGGVLAVLALGLLLGAGCTGSAPEPETEVIPLGPEFSGLAAAAHVRAISKQEDRSPNSEGDRDARAYLQRAFEAAGATVEELADGERRHLLARLPGESSDGVLLVAAYPALPETNWVDGSGAGLLVELARVSALETRPYTLYFGLADLRAVVAPSVSAPGVETEPGGAASPAMPAAEWAGSLGETRGWLNAAGESLANAFALRPEQGRLRAVIALDAPARPGLRLARDLRSHPLYRGLFWERASALGQGELFPEDGGWASPQSLHSGFHTLAQGRVLGLVDEQVARADLYSPPLSEAPSPETLLGLGSVTADALGGLMKRLAKIDAFAP